MSKAQIAKLQAQLKALPPGSPAAKALTAALERAKASLKIASPPPSPVTPEPTPILQTPEAPTTVIPESSPEPSPEPPILEKQVAEQQSSNSASSESLESPTIAPSPADPAPIYQAVGLLHAELHRNEIGHYYLRWRDQDWLSYLLKVPSRTALALLGQKVYWRVYPQSWSVDQDFRVNGFCIIGQAKDPTDLVDGQFTLAGCWQSFPYWQKEAKRPNYFTIYRNPSAKVKGDRYKYAQHYAINHWDEPASTPKRRYRQPWHKILATLQTDGSFDFMQVLDGPKPCPPRLQRPNPAPQKPEVSSDHTGDKALEASLQ
jgi:hypothetical protein